MRLISLAAPLLLVASQLRFCTRTWDQTRLCNARLREVEKGDFNHKAGRGVPTVHKRSARTTSSSPHTTSTNIAKHPYLARKTQHTRNSSPLPPPRERQLYQHRKTPRSKYPLPTPHNPLSNLEPRRSTSNLGPQISTPLPQPKGRNLDKKCPPTLQPPRQPPH